MPKHQDTLPVMPLAEARRCPRCGHEVVYNERFFCSSYAVNWCGWALSSADLGMRRVALSMALRLGEIRQVDYRPARPRRNP